MSAREVMRAAWGEVVRRHACGGSAADDLLNEMLQAYDEPQRHYHTIAHIAAMLRLLAEQEDVADRDAVLLSILFHDVIYDPARHDNEAASAEFATQHMTALGFNTALVTKVRRYIAATRHGQEYDTRGDPDLALLLDLDLSILATSPQEYREYAQAIRREYAAYPDDIYRPGRRRVLQSFLAREQIYLTPHLHAAWETHARENLSHEITELT